MGQQWKCLVPFSTANVISCSYCCTYHRIYHSTSEGCKLKKQNKNIIYSCHCISLHELKYTCNAIMRANNSSYSRKTDRCQCSYLLLQIRMLAVTWRRLPRFQQMKVYVFSVFIEQISLRTEVKGPAHEDQADWMRSVCVSVMVCAHMWSW